MACLVVLDLAILRYDEDERLSSVQTTSIARRQYHSTSRKEFYGAMQLVAGLGYEGYQTYRNEPHTPESAPKAQKSYRKLEERIRSAFSKAKTPFVLLLF